MGLKQEKKSLKLEGTINGLISRWTCL